jgi:rubredoxin
MKFGNVLFVVVYDESKGLPEEVLLQERVGKISGRWACPDCGVTKSDFEMQIFSFV